MTSVLLAVSTPAALSAACKILGCVPQRQKFPAQACFTSLAFGRGFFFSNAVTLDLNRNLEAALDGPVDLVATSALLDLVSETWLDRLAGEIAARSIPLYAALA